MNKSAQLKNMLTSGETLVMPDAYDPISARIIERAGFKAVQCSGYSMSIAACYQSEADLSIDENIETTRRIAKSVGIPVMADGEDGYGGPEEIKDTIRGFIEAGAAGINIEDLIPSRNWECRIVDVSLMLEKLTAARESSAVVPDFIINARTDALKAFDTREEGLKEAVKRANLYIEAGADLAFICYTATLYEVKTLVCEIRGPISIAAGQPYNIGEFTVDDLRREGVRRVSLPTLAIMASIQGMSSSISLIDQPNGFCRIVEEGLLFSRAGLTDLLRE